MYLRYAKFNLAGGLRLAATPGVQPETPKNKIQKESINLLVLVFSETCPTSWLAQFSHCTVKTYCEQ